MTEDPEDKRLRRVWPACVLVGGMLAMLRSRHLLPAPLVYALAVVTGIIAAAFEAANLRKQIAYSIPFILVGVGEIWLSATMDAIHPRVPSPREFMAYAFFGSVPGILLYALVRWRS